METPLQQASLQQLGGVPGVVGSMVFDRAGEVVASAFPPLFDAAGLQALAAQLAGDAYFLEWMVGEQAGLELRYADGHVTVRALDRSWLLVLCTAPANAQLLAMSLTQVVRRLRIPGGVTPAQLRPAPPAVAPPPPRLERLRAVVSAELGEHAAQALEILGAARPDRKDLLRATADVEKLTRLFISKKKAEEIAAKMRAIVDA
jgi:predicted regulator of Ras-like GTPase activity (Roadblock/LC7/MglB family)